MRLHWYPAYIGLGSNLGQPLKQLKTALDTISVHSQIRLIEHSSFYQTKPYGGVEQNDFVNAVAALLTTFSAEDLLSALLQIELEQGRERIKHWGPRTLDLDLLVYSDQTSDNDFLRLPHPEISKREFVLLPLCEIAPELYIPQLGRVSNVLVDFGITDSKKIET